MPPRMGYFGTDQPEPRFRRVQRPMSPRLEDSPEMRERYPLPGEERFPEPPPAERDVGQHMIDEGLAMPVPPGGILPQNRGFNPGDSGVGLNQDIPGFRASEVDPAFDRMLYQAELNGWRPPTNRPWTQQDWEAAWQAANTLSFRPSAEAEARDDQFPVSAEEQYMGDIEDVLGHSAIVGDSLYGVAAATDSAYNPLDPNDPELQDKIEERFMYTHPPEPLPSVSELDEISRRYQTRDMDPTGSMGAPAPTYRPDAEDLRMREDVRRKYPNRKYKGKAL